MLAKKIQLLKTYIITAGTIDFYNYELDMEERIFQQLLDDLLENGSIYLIKNSRIEKYFRQYPYFLFKNSMEIEDFVLCTFNVKDYIKSDNFLKLFNEQKMKIQNEIKKAQDKLHLLDNIESQLDSLAYDIYSSNTK